MTTTKTQTYKKAYAILARVTPILGDCGALCGARCCMGGDEDGMLIYPGEEELLRKQSFLHLKPIELDGIPAHFAVCDGAGQCVRLYRPFSCRVFPLTPYIGAEGRMDVIFDPRARYLCPLAAQRTVTPAFRQAVVKASRILAAEPEIAAFISALSVELDAYKRFTE